MEAGRGPRAKRGGAGQWRDADFNDTHPFPAVSRAYLRDLVAS